MKPPSRPLRSPALIAVLSLLVVLLVGFFWRYRHEPGHFVAGHSVEGRPLKYTVHGDGPRVVMFMASIHGSEGAGTPLLGRFARYLEKYPETLGGLTVIILPVANPDGLSRSDRLNIHGVDLNRNFPAGNRRDSDRFGLTALSEPESRALHTLIVERRPELIVSIHQPLACVDWDGPPGSEAVAKRVADACGLPVKKLGARPGSLGAWFSEIPGKPILTLELPRESPVDESALWKKYGPGLLAALQD